MKSRKTFHVIILICLVGNLLKAQSLATPVSDQIHIDQFGYLPTASKVAVLADPQTGYNAAVSYVPPVNLKVVDANTNNEVLSSSRVVWNAGATHGQSGDKGWWLDFSAFTTPGSYYLYDASNIKRSNVFDIKADVYKDVLKAACRMYYYNRCNMSKSAPYAEPKWVDSANNFMNAGQDGACKNLSAPTNASLFKDLSGGWFDAGDYNKYVTFAVRPIHELLLAYEINNQVFGDNWNLPESGNGIADIIDEIKWELDWLKKMQNTDGSVIIKMGSINYSHNASSPPSNNFDPRYYGPTCTSATVGVASMFAHAAYIFKGTPQLSTEATTLKNLAILSWDKVLPAINSNTLQLNCDDGTIKSGDADQSAATQKEEALVAAFYLYQITTDEIYHTYFKNHINDAGPVSANWLGTNNMPLNNVLMQYTTETFANAATKSEIINSILPHIQGDWDLFFRWNEADLYRANMPDWAYHWGSNIQKASFGNLAALIKRYNIDIGNNAALSKKAEEQLHYFHGVNPQNMVYLSNMYGYGGEKCANEIYHSWFNDGTIYDNALTSPNGPAPGYVTGGPNKDFSVSTLVPPSGQPIQKSYLDFNSGSPQNSWEITEPAIYYQAAYVLLLSNYAPIANIVLPIKVSNFSARNLDVFDVSITWTVSGEGDLKTLILQKSPDGKSNWKNIFNQNNFKDEVISEYIDINPWLHHDHLYYRLKITSRDGMEETSDVSVVNALASPEKQTLYIFPNPSFDVFEISNTDAIVFSKVSIFNSEGKLMKEIYNPGNSINVDDLKSGNYNAVFFQDTNESTTLQMTILK